MPSPLVDEKKKKERNIFQYEINDLLSHGKTWRKLKLILLVERSPQFEKGIYHRIPKI